MPLTGIIPSTLQSAGQDSSEPNQARACGHIFKTYELFISQNFPFNISGQLSVAHLNQGKWNHRYGNCWIQVWLGAQNPIVSHSPGFRKPEGAGASPPLFGAGFYTLYLQLLILLSVSRSTAQNIDSSFLLIFKNWFLPILPELYLFSHWHLSRSASTCLLSYPIDMTLWFFLLPSVTEIRVCFIPSPWVITTVVNQCNIDFRQLD